MVLVWIAKIFLPVDGSRRLTGLVLVWFWFGFETILLPVDGSIRLTGLVLVSIVTTLPPVDG